MGMKSLILKALILFQTSTVLFAIEDGNVFSVKKTGVLKVDTLTFQITNHDSTWKNPTSPTKCAFDSSVRKGKEYYKLIGIFSAYGGSFKMRADITTISPNSIQCTYILKSSKGVATKQLALQTIIDPKNCSGTSILLDGRKYGFKQKLNEKKWNSAFSNISVIEIPLNKGTLVIKGEHFRGNLIDRRMYNASGWELRVNFSHSEGIIKNSNFKCVMKWKPVDNKNDKNKR